MRRLGLMPGFFAGLVIASPAASAGDAVTGEAIAQRWCVSCHLIDGGTARDTAPPFAALARDPTLTPGRLAAYLSDPHGGMKGMAFTRQEIDDLVAWIETGGSNH